MVELSDLKISGGLVDGVLVFSYGGRKLTTPYRYRDWPQVMKDDYESYILSFFIE